MQTINIDLAVGDVYEASKNLSMFMNIDCVSKISMRDGLIVILCAEKHTLSVLFITEDNSLLKVFTDK